MSRNVVVRKKCGTCGGRGRIWNAYKKKTREYDPVNKKWIVSYIGGWDTCSQCVNGWQ